MKLGTPYPEVVDRVVKVTGAAELAGRSRLVVDATGVGRPVVDLLRRAGPKCTLMPATITSGETEGYSEGYYRVPKKDLITGVQVLLQEGELQIAGRLKHAAELTAELAEMKVKLTAGGNTQYGAWREGTHDDLVLAVALACWAVRKLYPGKVSGEAGYWTRDDTGEWETGLRKWGEQGKPLL